MNLNPRTRCPYTLKRLNELTAVNDEHVIPDALGCPASYSVFADMASNSTLGSTVDANFVDDDLVQMFRHQHGVRSRSGPASWIMEGKTVDGQHPVKITLPFEGPTQIHFKKPFIRSEDGVNATLVSGADWEERLEKLKQDCAKKGKKLTVGSREELPNTVVNVQGQINLTHQKVGLMKIAYLAAFEYLGDPFLDEPLNGEWRKFIRATTLEEIENTPLRAAFHERAEVLDQILPPLEDHQHAVVVTGLNPGDIVIGVRLFGSTLLSVVCQISQAQRFGLGLAQGKLVICDSKAKTRTVSSYEKFFLQRCGVATSTKIRPAHQDVASNSPQSSDA